MREVIAPLVAALEAGRAVAFCQVVATRGSTPQGAGAMMLLEPDGTQVGTLGGGCVEAEVKRQAVAAIGAGGPTLSRYTLDHDPAWADGLICGGRMTVLVECPRGPAALAYYRAYRDCLGAGSGLTEVIAADLAKAEGATAGDRTLFDHAGGQIAALGGLPSAPAAVVARLGTMTEATEMEGWAYLPTKPRVRLLIVGAGHVGQAVAALAARVDFAVWVVDDRAELVTPDRFPTADRRVVGPILPTLTGLKFDPSTYALVVTRGHGHDQEAVGHLAPTSAGYVGMIGSRRKIRTILDELRDAGLAEEALGRIAAPVGLDIGSESVDEIAISIVAELVARRNRGADALAQLRAASGRRPLP